MRKVIVTYEAKLEERRILNAILDSLANLVILAGLAPPERVNALKSADVLLSWNLTKELQAEELEAISNVKMLQLLSAGADHLPYSKLPSGLIVAANVGAYADPIAEHVLAMVLALEKHLVERHDKLKRGEFDQANLNRKLRGSSCAILGFGGIGRAVGKLLRGFDVKIYAINTTGRTGEDVEFIGTLKDLERVLPLADVVVISIPLTASTRGLIGKRELAWMKNDAIMINVARGEIVDEAALFEKLKANPGFMAGIDTWWEEPHTTGRFRTNYPFFELPNFLGSPHNSGVVPGIMNIATQRAAENIRRYLNGETPLGIVRPESY
jgi:phosphoglycerate dehydrogenase-like enzyme